MEKRKLVVSYKNASEEVLEAIKKKYHTGYHDFVIKVTKPNNDFFYAITVDTNDASYLVKVDVKIDNLTEEEFEKEFGDDNNNSGGEEGSIGREDDNIDANESTESFEE